MRALFVLSSAAFLAVLIAGCSEGSDGDAEEVGKGWRAASSAISSGTAGLASLDAGEDADAVQVCPEGGRLVLTGSFEAQDRYELSVRFEDCQADGVTMNGEMSMAAYVAHHGRSIEFEYVGQVEFTGAANLSCGIDVLGRVGTSPDGRTPPGEPHFYGTVCGYRADEVIDVS